MLLKKTFVLNSASGSILLLLYSVFDFAEKSWSHKAINNLVYQHLKENRYQYSLSMFQLEANTSKYSVGLSIQ